MSRLQPFYRHMIPDFGGGPRFKFSSRELGHDSCHEETLMPYDVPARHWRILRKPDALWDFFAEYAENRFKNKNLELDLPLLIICANPLCGRRLVRHFASRGGGAHLATDVEEAFGALKKRPGDWSLVILDLDSFGGILELSDDLMDFRVEAPEMPVLLLSSGFFQDDLTKERLPMCDASIRSPALSLSIFKGVKAAIENNKSWRYRRGVLK